MISLSFRDPAFLPPALRFLAGGGEATRLILERDWSSHSFEDPSHWPDTLKSNLSTVLNSPESMILACGIEAVTLRPEAPPAGAGETVLVVDDESTVRMLIVEVLEDLGYRAIEASDGAGGLKILRSNVRIDLLVTDVGLPGGMNGRQLADAGRVLRSELKVLFITGYAEAAVLGYGSLEEGMHVMTKPFAMDGLASRVKGLLAP